MRDAPHRRPRRPSGRFDQMAWCPPLLTDPPVEPLGAEGVQAIHAAAMTILRDTGIVFRHAGARDILARAGCRVEGMTVRMDEGFVTEMVARAPGPFAITPRNPDRAITVGGRHLTFSGVASPPNVWDSVRGKRPGDRAAFRDFLKLSQAFNCIHLIGGYPVEPVDLHPSVRHLDCLHDMLTLTDKVVHAYSLGPERIEDGMEMARIAAGVDEATFRARPHMFTNINSVSPLQHDEPMIDGALRCARRGQAVVVTPFTLAGAMAPVTLAGAVALSLAEALAAIALIQFDSPGAPVAFGTFTSNVDMKSGAPAFGTPEYMRATQMSGQMARFYGLPLRSSGVCTANVPDAQAAWETAHSLWAAVQSGTNMVYHAAGWLEGGLIASPEKFVLDCEIVQMIQRYLDPALTATTEGDLALDAVAEVGPGGHYFGCAHTQARYQTAFYAPIASDWRNFEAWQAAGAEDSVARAHRIARGLIEGFEAPALDDARAEELADYVARRKAEGGAPTDY